jgi:hypothetical protein
MHNVQAIFAFAAVAVVKSWLIKRSLRSPWNFSVQIIALMSMMSYVLDVEYV